MSRTLIHNARIASSGGVESGWVLIDGDTIAATGRGSQQPGIDCDTAIDASGALLMPGAIDTHVHFRDPGLTHKATMASESRAALAGGVTSVIDMPNTIPTTTTIEAWQQKCDIARNSMAVNYAFYIGATSDNIDQLRRADYTAIPGIKLFMGSSTGGMAVTDDSALRRVFAETGARIAIHAEDDSVIAANIARLKASNPDTDSWPMALHSEIRAAEACVRATEAAMEMAQRYGSRLHVCHVTTALECGLLDSGDIGGKSITAEVSPHHLLWCADDYSRLGSRIKMNPAVKTAADREALCGALAAGRLDIIATDHAPHLLSEKQGGPLKAVSGAPMVQFSLPAMLDMLPPEQVALRMAEVPARLFGIAGRGFIAAGMKADLALVEEHEPRAVSDADVVSLCGWTPMAGTSLRHTVAATWINGRKAYDSGNFNIEKTGEPLRFNP